MSMGGSASVKAEPNVTPMIDVMLVLLIIFMLVVPAISAGFQAIPPQGVNLKPHPEEERDQVLGIDANGQYFLNKAPIPKSGAWPETQDDL
jgi:biopolymer transport protein ExbD